MMKTISVIIPTYNYARFLREAIDSALAQTHAPLEVIVVDDGSTDETAQVLAEYGAKIRPLWQENQGVAAARNTGLAAARGEYVTFLDSDDVWKPRKLERQIARFDADPALGLVHCGVETFDRDGRTLTTHLGGMEGWVAADLLRLNREVIIAGSNIMVPRRVAEEIGGFDVRLPPSEDWDFYYRVATRYRFGYVAEPLVRYRLHGSGGHMNIRRMENGMLLAFEKAFASPDSGTQSLRRESYGRLHRILAGCYFEARKPWPFVRHMIRSLRYDTRNLGYFAAYPLRVIARRRRSARSAATPET
jgi:glycosyltransferase involved in cell wall biosynthesis